MPNLDEIVLTNEDIIEIKKSLLKESFFDFVLYFWDVVITDKFEYNWHIQYLCDELQIVAQWVIDETDKLYDLVVNICPGTSKSTLVSRMLPVWIWINNPKIFILSNTIDDNNAKEFARASKDLIQSEEFQELFPEIQIRQDVSAVNYYENIFGGTRYSFTTKGRNKTGKHAHLLLDDDPMDYLSSQSEAETKKCIDGFKALQTRKKNKKKTPYILVTQKLSSKDTASHALKTLPKVKHICLPAENKHGNVKPEELNEKYVDGLLDPNRLSRDTLEAEKKGLTDNENDAPLPELDYETQYNQQEIDEKGLLYQINLTPFSKLPIPETEKIKISSLDSANGGDNLSNPYGFLWNGKFYVDDVIYNKDSIEVNKIKIENKSYLYGQLINLIETNGIGSIIYSWFDLINKIGINEAENKTTRIKAFAWIISNYFVFNSENMNPEYVAFISHLKKFPKNAKATHDDAEDSLTLIAKYLYINYRYLFQNAA